jgi:hypothetical protein
MGGFQCREKLPSCEANWKRALDVVAKSPQPDEVVWCVGERKRLNGRLERARPAPGVPRIASEGYHAGLSIAQAMT